MNVLPILLIVSLIMGCCFLAAFIWAVRSGQFDDTTTPAFRLFFDDETDNRKGRGKREEA
ncbi:MAG: cbb3-type cytochrome oxidase assembly protein CcoS [Verrucomicrobiota bacterium]